MYYTNRRSKDGKYWWRAVGDNNKIMAASELMESKQSCLSAIATMKSEAASGATHDKTGETSVRGQV